MPSALRDGAQKLGFVDQLGNFQDAVDRAKLLLEFPTPT